MSNVPCWDILFQVFSEAFILLLGSLVACTCGYLSVWAVQGDLVIPGLIFIVLGWLFCRRVLCITKILFVLVDYLQYLAILRWLVLYNQNGRCICHTTSNNLTCISTNCIAKRENLSQLSISCN